MSQRDVYYSLKSLFKKQEDCNRVILVLGKALGLKRHQMRIEPSTRGSVAGDLQFKPPSYDHVIGLYSPIIYC